MSTPSSDLFTTTALATLRTAWQAESGGLHISLCASTRRAPQPHRNVQGCQGEGEDARAYLQHGGSGAAKPWLSSLGGAEQHRGGQRRWKQGGKTRDSAGTSKRQTNRAAGHGGRTWRRQFMKQMAGAAAAGGAALMLPQPARQQPSRHLKPAKRQRPLAGSHRPERQRGCLAAPRC